MAAHIINSSLRLNDRRDLLLYSLVQQNALTMFLSLYLTFFFSFRLGLQIRSNTLGFTEYEESLRGSWLQSTEI